MAMLIPHLSQDHFLRRPPRPPQLTPQLPSSTRYYRNVRVLETQAVTLETARYTTTVVQQVAQLMRDVMCSGTQLIGERLNL